MSEVKAANSRALAPLEKARRTLRDAGRAPGSLLVISFVSVGLLVILAHRATDFLEVPQVDQTAYDIVGDLVFVKTAWSGGNPYQPMKGMAEFADSALVEGWPSKTPAVAVLMAPLLLTDPVGAVRAMTWINISALLAAVIVTARLAGTGLTPSLLVAPLLAAMSFAHQGFKYATPSFIVSFFVLATWGLARKGDRFAYGLPLGLAAALRVWPALLLFPLILKGRHRTAFGTIAAALSATVGGLAVLDWQLSAVRRGLATAATYWRGHSGNGSLALALDRLGLGTAAILILAVVTAALMLLVGQFNSLDQALALAITVGVTVSPLSWAHYSLVALPVVALTWRAATARWALVVAGAITATLTAGAAVLVARVALLWAVSRWVRWVRELPTPELSGSDSPV